mgnify:FL=1
MRQVILYRLGFFLFSIDKHLQILYDSQHKENLFSLCSFILCIFLFNFPYFLKPICNS